MTVLQPILAVLTDAVLQGAAHVVDVRRRGTIGARYKDATELVTDADRRSDAAILQVFLARFPRIDPSISFYLEESGTSGTAGSRIAGADPLDGTSHFAAGGTMYSIQAHYMEDGVPLVGVVFQPEIFLPLAETENCLGRMVTAIHGGGAWVHRTELTAGGFDVSAGRPVMKRPAPDTRAFVACVPFSGKMTISERALARRVHESGIISLTTGTGGAGGNVMMVVFGGQDVYANFGAGEDLDLAPPQVIAEEIGLTVWTVNRRPPVWHTRKQPFIVAPNDAIAECFLQAAGL